MVSLTAVADGKVADGCCTKRRVVAVVGLGGGFGEVAEGVFEVDALFQEQHRCRVAKV
ncbi:hypothetical protein [Streptomyces sp. NPDC127039]|uniref:hypothetical protein n=1 Tax=Streptomyces sp. NPDC127039 TaxID=3347115 RepID=UPI00365093D7